MSTTTPPTTTTTTTTIPTTPCAIQSWDPESPADWSHFRSVPWLAPILSRPGVRPYRNALPGGPPDRGGDPLLGGFMARDGGILRHASLLADPGVLPDLDGGEESERGGGGGGGSEANPFPQHIDLYTLGPGLAGLPHTLHGGVLCMLVDAACGRVGYMHRGGDDHRRRNVYTAHTNTRFRRPGIMDGPGDTLTVMVRTQVSARLSSAVAAPPTAEELVIEDGRGKAKMIVLSSVEGEGGKVFVTGESSVALRVWKSKGEDKGKEKL